MGSFQAGQRISLRYRAKKDQSGSVTLGAAVFRTDLFDQAYALLSERSMIPTLVSDTRVEGAIRVLEPGLLYLSIPNDDGWTLTVDGEETRLSAVGDAMLAVHLEPGLHAIALEYETPGFSLGLKISVISLAIFLALLILALLTRFTSPPIVKVPVALADPRRSADAPDPDAPPAAEPIPPKAPGATMPRLDLAQSWDAVKDLPAEQPNSDEALSEDELLAEAARLAGSPAPTVPARQEAAEAPARRALLSTTGVFDPSAIQEEPPEPEKKSSSFQALEYLDRLEKLLEKDAPQAEAPQEPAEAPQEPAEAPQEPAEAPQEPAEAPQEPAEAPREAPEEPGTQHAGQENPIPENNS